MVKLVTRYKDRRKFLERSIQTWLRNDFYTEIIIVDWTSKDDILSFLKDLKDNRITLLRVKGQKYIDRGAAWNVGIKYADSTWIHAVDCDVMLNPNIFRKVDFSDLKSYYLSIRCNSTRGSCLFPKYAWELVNGYFEGLKSYGAEDTYFYACLKMLGLKEKIVFSNRDIYHIEHSHTLRQENHEIKYNDGGYMWARKSDADNWKIISSTDHIHRKMGEYDFEIIKINE